MLKVFFFLLLFKVRKGPEVKEQDFAPRITSCACRDRIYISFMLIIPDSLSHPWPPPEKVVCPASGQLALPCTLKAAAAYALQIQLDLSKTSTQPKADEGGGRVILLH